MKPCGLGFADLAAIGNTDSRETIIPWNRNTGEPVAKAIAPRVGSRGFAVLADDLDPQHVALGSWRAPPDAVERNSQYLCGRDTIASGWRAALRPRYVYGSWTRKVFPPWDHYGQLEWR